MSERLRLSLQARVDSLSTLTAEVEKFAEAQEWDPGLAFQIPLILEELTLNVIKHGFQSDGSEFEVAIESDPDVIRIEITDGAQPFNPLTDAPVPDTDASIEDRQVGGLGVHFARSIMDEMSYAREDGKNRVTLVKHRSA